jgi:hypothetical protein
MVIYGVPKRTPRRGPNGTVPCMDLVDSVAAQLFLTCKIEDQKMDRGPLVLAVQKDVLW